ADLTKSAVDATKPNAGNDIVKPADKTVVANPEQLTDAEKKAIEDKVKAVNPEATVVVDDKGNATVTTPEGKTAVIPATDLTKSATDATKPNAGNDIVKPADKTVVANPEQLTDAEKKAIEDKVKAVNPGATVAVDDKGNATVTTPEGKTAVIPAADLTKSAADAAKPNAGNDIVKPADKTVVANPDALTPEEKKAIEDKVKAVNPGATVAVDDKGNATVTTPEGKTAVIPAADLTKDPAAATKPNAGNDIVKPADKTVVANPEKLTDAEKKAIKDKVKAVNPDATVVVDDKGNATVTTPEGKTAVIPAADLTKDSAAATKPNAGNDIVKPASKTKVANPDSLTKDEKDAIATKVKAVNPGVTVVVDDKGNATVTLPNGNTAVIPASDLTKSEKDVNDGKAKDNAVTPASKTKVANPEKLTDAEKKAIEDKVKAANPGAEVVVDDKGNATVVQDGNVSVIPSTDLVKVEDDANKPNGGNDANTPAAKTVVKDPANLTDEEKAKVKKAVEAVNPGSTVVVDDKGNATVTKGDGTVLNIPASDLVIPAEKLADEATNAKVKTPAVRTLVGDKENLTDAEKEAVKKTIEAVNPGATVVVDDKGNATVTMPDGSTATISKEQLVKDKEAVSKSKHGGDNLDIDLSKVEVADLANITPEEKAKFQFKVLGAITNVEKFDLDAYIKSTDKDGNTVYTSKDSKVKITIDKDGNMKVMKDGKLNLAVNIDKAGNVTIVTKEGQVLAIPRDDAFKQRPSAQNNGGNGTSGNNGATNNESKVDKAKLEGAIRQLDELIIKESAKFDAETAKEANKLSADAKKVFANADATQAEVDAMVKRIEDFMAKVASSTDHATPATAQAASNASQEAAENARKAAKELPNTGTADSVAFMVAAAASAVLGIGLAVRRRKEDEEA
ncbi:LPXTG cell wall anchor domain-containing protein, partial [Streptococcus sp. SM3]|uniref:LPXTG cell wall anchor domain-containing protein n=1 Tax=Streptococcus sp. SM3 TaxID=2898231 RepID=UPI0022B7988A